MGRPYVFRIDHDSSRANPRYLEPVPLLSSFLSNLMHSNRDMFFTAEAQDVARTDTNGKKRSGEVACRKSFGLEPVESTKAGQP